jgi:four helix bundle protein
MSRGSCHECVPLIDMAFKLGLIDQKEKAKWLEEVVILSKMLIKLKNSL